MTRRGSFVVAPFAIAMVAMVHCGDDDAAPPGMGPGVEDMAAGGGGGCPGSTPQALFTIVVAAENDARLPTDTSIGVRWSAGDEPAFELDDTSTWRSLDESNVVCDVEGDPTALLELTCELWTSGPTEVTVNGLGYLELVSTLTPQLEEECEGPIPSRSRLVLERDPDAP